MTRDEAVRGYTDVYLLLKMATDAVGPDITGDVVREWLTGIYTRSMERNRRNLGITGTGPRDFFNCSRAWAGSEGLLQQEVVEETPDQLVYEIRDCVFLEVCEAVGLDPELHEQWIIPTMEKIPQFLNPNLEWNVEYNLDPQAPCTYRIRYKKDR